MNFNSWNWFWSVCFGVSAVVIIISNSLSIAVLVKGRFRKRSLYLLIDLAIADLLVGLFAVPIYMITVISEDKFMPGVVLDSVDMFTGLSSIFTLTVISLERLFAISRPLRHRQLSSHSYAIAIATPWILSLAVTSVRVLQHYSIVANHQIFTVITISLSTSLLITCTSYCVIWRKQTSRIQNGVRARTEARMSKILFLITGTFVLTWLPFKVLLVVVNMCVPCSRKMLAVVVFVLKLLQFSNSFINFLIYCLRMPDYRKAVSQLFSSANPAVTPIILRLIR
ncbi:beta-1 adrenergic receptor-like [Orbicella faveolata]|uniref:beta-1 adrenergic receptor-like n=1 Tax=Orbicella faveolata TaxID=48498 RepID=UPI0009E537B9|nr:beta-1 adrenergic receptor-like [Orbicella faveolata]